MQDQGFDKKRIPDEMWMTPGEVVAASLASLGSGRVLVVPGEGNQSVAKMGLQQQLDAL